MTPPANTSRLAPQDDLLGMAQWLAARDELLSPREQKFAQDMLKLLRRPGVTISPRQADWLRAIYRNIGGRP